jgi:hypothetical protein
MRWEAVFTPYSEPENYEDVASTKVIGDFSF